MKSNKKIYLLLSLCGCLMLGLIFGKAILQKIFVPNTYVISSHPLAIARDIKEYSQNADTIVVGIVSEVNNPYVVGNSVILQQDALVEVQEVLKGDTTIKKLEVTDLGREIVDELEVSKISTLEGRSGLLKPKEKVLLFLAKTNSGDFMIYAYAYGKYLIDEQNNVTSIGDFRMSFEELETQIQAALKEPVTNKTISLPISEEN